MQNLSNPLKLITLSFFLFLTLIDLYAQDYKVHLKGYENVIEIINAIETQTDISIAYDSSFLQQAKVESLAKDDYAVQFLIDLLVKDTDYKVKKIGNRVIIIPSENNNKDIMDISGQVIDMHGDPIIGASIIIKGTDKGTISDIKGQFNIGIKANEKLEVSSIGYITQEIAITNTKFQKIVLKDDTIFLDEVVVVGYGSQKKSTLTGSVASINNKEMLETKTVNITNSLTGRIPGLTINSRGGNPGEESSSILIRGMATTGDNSPLYVIDGVANRGGFERLTPDDIESISVLKDASAAIYGAQAANGVILVTTKRGKKGKIHFHYNDAFSFSQPTRRPNLMNAEQYLTWYDEQNERNGRPLEYQNIIRQYRKGTIDKTKWGDTDWWNEVMDKWSFEQQHVLSIDGGTDKFSYYISGQFVDQDAVYKSKAYGYKQYNFRANIDSHIAKYLTVGVDFSFRNGDIKTPTLNSHDLFRQIYIQRPFDLPYFENGLVAKTRNGNPINLTNGESGEKRKQVKRIESKMSARLDMPFITKGLYLQGYVAYDYSIIYKKELYSPYDIWTYNSSTGEYSNEKDQTGTTSLFQDFFHDTSLNFNVMLGYANTFGNHNVSAMVAYEQSTTYNESFFASRQDLVSKELPYLFSGSEIGKKNGGVGFNNARQNIFGRINYDYQEKYLAEITFRYDGSANFAKKNRFGFFPGVSLGWRISEEDFLKGSVVNNLKVRTSWGLLGNDRVNPFQYLQLYKLQDSYIFGEKPNREFGLSPNVSPNYNITWETAQKFNLALDFNLWNSKLMGTVEYFYEKRSDILAPRNASVPEFSGLKLPDENIGKTQNTGCEFQLSHYNSVGEFNYNVGGVFSFVQSEILFIDEAINTPEWQRRTGHPIDYIKLYEADGLFQNQDEINAYPHFPDAKPGDVKFVDQDNNGIVDSNDEIILSQSNSPKITYGINFGFEWKGVSLNMLFQGQGMAKSIFRPWDLNQNVEYFQDRWISSKKTPHAKYPAAFDMSSSSIQKISTIWLKDCDFLRLKNFQLSYSIPKKLLSKIKIDELKINLSGNNLFFVYDKVKMADPESTDSSGWYYPQQRLVSLGLSVIF